MRKSLLILSFVGLIGSSVDARTLTPAEALARALDNGKTSAPHRAPLRKSPILTVGEQNSPSLYVFDQGNEGYLVVSADDVAAPVLGYSTTGSIDPTTCLTTCAGGSISIKPKSKPRQKTAHRPIRSTATATVLLSSPFKDPLESGRTLQQRLPSACRQLHSDRLRGHRNGSSDELS